MRRPSLAVKLAVLLVGLPCVGLADPPTDGVRAQTDEAEPREVPATLPPLLGNPRTTHLTMDMATDQKLSRLELGDLKMTLGGEWLAPHSEVDVDVSSPVRLRAWRVAGGLSYPLFWGIVAHAEVGFDHLDSELGRTNMVSYGVGITRWFHLFGLRWYADLSAGRRRWIGDIPGGEFDDTTVMLRIGFHWR